MSEIFHYSMSSGLKPITIQVMENFWACSRTTHQWWVVLDRNK